MNKIPVLLMILTVYCKTVFSQMDSIRASILLNNDSIQYDILMKTPDARTMKTDPIIHRYVIVKMSKQVRQFFIRENVNFWMPYLTDDRSDWAANLILYCIYKKDAEQLEYLYTDRRKWLRVKPSDINYWREYLSKKK